MVVALGEALTLLGWLLLGAQVAIALGIICLGLVIGLVIKSMAGD